MSSDDRARAAAEPGAGDPERRAELSRRSVLRGAAGTGVAGLAAGALLSGVAGPALAASTGHEPRAGHPAAGHAAGDDSDAPGEDACDVVVHVRDARSGEMDVFSGTSHTRLRDRDLAARLVRATTTQRG
ncbi:MAG: hypothetical protein ACLQI7_01325 [Streptosporangiaceae bacterium]